MKRKTLQELTLKDNFMFAAVMLDPENCKGVLERALDIKINHVNVQYVRSGKIQHGDTYVEQLSASVNRVKSDRDMGARFMLLEEMMKDE